MSWSRIFIDYESIFRRGTSSKDVNKSLTSNKFFINNVLLWSWTWLFLLMNLFYPRVSRATTKSIWFFLDIFNVWDIWLRRDFIKCNKWKHFSIINVTFLLQFVKWFPESASIVFFRFKELWLFRTKICIRWHYYILFFPLEFSLWISKSVAFLKRHLWLDIIIVRCLSCSCLLMLKPWSFWKTNRT